MPHVTGRGIGWKTGERQAFSSVCLLHSVCLGMPSPIAAKNRNSNPYTCYASLAQNCGGLGNMF
jgi:hypothetical protein